MLFLNHREKALVPACRVPVLFHNILMERKAKRDFLFIDETGDPGKDISGGSSAYFALGAVHVTDISLEKLLRHLYAMGYFSGRFKELKSSRLSRFQKDQIEDIAKALCESDDFFITVIFVDKRLYSGPYFSLQDGPKPDPVRFRNFFGTFGNFLFLFSCRLYCIPDVPQ